MAIIQINKKQFQKSIKNGNAAKILQTSIFWASCLTHMGKLPSENIKSIGKNRQKQQNTKKTNKTKKKQTSLEILQSSWFYFLFFGLFLFVLFLERLIGLIWFLSYSTPRIGLKPFLSSAFPIRISAPRITYTHTLSHGKLWFIQHIPLPVTLAYLKPSGLAVTPPWTRTSVAWTKTSASCAWCAKLPPSTTAQKFHVCGLRVIQSWKHHTTVVVATQLTVSHSCHPFTSLGLTQRCGWRTLSYSMSCQLWHPVCTASGTWMDRQKRHQKRLRGYGRFSFPIHAAVPTTSHTAWGVALVVARRLAY